MTTKRPFALESFNGQSKKGRLQTTVYGEWKNFTGGQLIISRGQLFPQPHHEWGLELIGGRGFGQFRQNNRQPILSSSKCEKTQNKKKTIT